jgi:hypothetical protein
LPAGRMSDLATTAREIDGRIWPRIDFEKAT